MILINESTRETAIACADEIAADPITWCKRIAETISKKPQAGYKSYKSTDIVGNCCRHTECAVFSEISWQ